MSLKYIMSEKNIQDGCSRVRGGDVWGGLHNFISLGVPKGQNPALIIAIKF